MVNVLLAGVPIAFENRYPDPTCKPADQKYSIDCLFHQLLMPEKPEQMMQLLDMVDKLVESVPCYRLRCDMTGDSVLAAYEASKEQLTGKYS